MDFKVTSLTEWAAQLKINPPFAILSGFEFGNTPGVGTFYDFLNRLWDSDEDNMTPHIHPIKTTVKKPSTKGAKAKSVEKVSVEQLLQELEDTSFSISEQPYNSLFDLYNQEFLQQSVSKGLINPNSLAIAGDGTPFVTSARERKHRVCDCAPHLISHRHFLAVIVTVISVRNILTVGFRFLCNPSQQVIGVGRCLSRLFALLILHSCRFFSLLAIDKIFRTVLGFPFFPPGPYKQPTDFYRHIHTWFLQSCPISSCR